MKDTMQTKEVQCCVVGGGPAGMVAGLLLARQGIDVLVLEKHGDFLRDFRGDTIHPSTLELIHELGWLDEFLRLPHTKMNRVTVAVGGNAITFADFGKLKVHCRYVAFMPQWDFLDFLADHAFARTKALPLGSCDGFSDDGNSPLGLHRQSRCVFCVACTQRICMTILHSGCRSRFVCSAVCRPCAMSSAVSSVSACVRSTFGANPGGHVASALSFSHVTCTGTVSSHGCRVTISATFT
jgi:FAD binding domain